LKKDKNRKNKLGMERRKRELEGRKGRRRGEVKKKR